MTSPDARPVGEMRDAEREAENEVLHLALRLANWDPPSVMDLKDAPLLEAHARALTAYRDAVAAEARAALLRDATAVTLNHDGTHIHFTTIMPNGRQRHLGAVDATFPGLGIPPGTVRRYALVPIEEEGT